MKKIFLLLTSTFLLFTNTAYAEEGNKVLQASIQETQSATINGSENEAPKKKKATKKGKKNKKAKKTISN